MISRTDLNQQFAFSFCTLNKQLTDSRTGTYNIAVIEAQL